MSIMRLVPLFIMNVIMINVQELIIHLQKKITQYRYQQKRTAKAKTDIRNGRHLLTSLKIQLQEQVNSLLKVYRTKMTTQVTAIADYCQDVIERIKEERNEEVNGLRSEIARQHHVISAMRKQVQDLQELMIMQTVSMEREQDENAENGQQKNKEGIESPHGRTFGGLQVIQEETQRTIMSSARSNQQERSSIDAFIRIQQRQPQQQQPSFQRQLLPEFKLATSIDRESSMRTHSESSSPSEWASQQQSGISKLEQLMELSHFSHRQHSLGQEKIPQYQSLPIDTQSYSRQQLAQECRTWQGEPELKDITNSRSEDQQERQSRSKMFLEEFRKTFNKCLTSSNTSRKNSTKNQNKSSKISAREDKEKERENRGEGPKDTQRLISQMLKDIDNNNKFLVGNRKLEVRYEGAKRGGCRQGQGKLYYSNGLSYEGQFRNNMRHGYGVLRNNEKQIYRGWWQADELAGQGKLSNNGLVNRKKHQPSATPLLKWSSYCGSFRNNRFEGEGTLELQGGDRFLGKFICGAACGEGTLYRKNGQVETGIWRNNQLVELF